MGIYRIFMKSIIFSTRSRRRFIPFVIVFSVLSGATIILLYGFETNSSRENLLVHRGVVIKAASMDSVMLSQAQTDIGSHSEASAIIYYKYVNFGPNLRIFSMSPQYIWAFSDLSPTDLVSGSFPKKAADVLVSENALFRLNDTQGSVNIFSKPVVGTSLTIGRTQDSTFKLRISGIYKKPTVINNDNREWIFVTEDAFSTLTNSDNLNYGPGSIFVHSISIIASGDFFTGNVYTNVDTIHARLAPTIDPNTDYNNVQHTPKSQKEGERTMTFLSLIFGMFGTFMVSTLYSYLITRFRRREVAVLKAMGYSKWDVRVVVLCEILVVAVVGYLIGLISVQGYLFLNHQGSYFYQFITFSTTELPFIFISTTVFLSFPAVVISCVPGFLLITFRTLSVRPIEIFRQK